MDIITLFCEGAFELLQGCFLFLVILSQSLVVLGINIGSFVTDNGLYILVFGFLFQILEFESAQVFLVEV